MSNITFCVTRIVSLSSRRCQMCIGVLHHCNVRIGSRLPAVQIDVAIWDIDSFALLFAHYIANLNIFALYVLKYELASHHHRILLKNVILHFLGAPRLTVFFSFEYFNQSFRIKTT